MSNQTVEDAFEGHRQAQRIREAIAYVKAWTTVGDDEMLQWADGEVMDAAGKYADYLETRAYAGPIDYQAGLRALDSIVDAAHAGGTTQDDVKAIVNAAVDGVLKRGEEET